MSELYDYDIIIADYFDNKMSVEQEVAFMEQLGNNAELRQCYEDELTMRAIFGTGARQEQQLLEEAAVAPEDSKKKTTTIFRSFSRQAYAIAAVFVLVIAATAVYIIVNNNGGKIVPIAQTHGNKIDSPAKNIAVAPAPPDSVVAAKAFAKVYKPYTSGESDPVEASEQYQQYKQGKYNDVLKATAGDVQVMGVEDDKNKPLVYLQLYKGLAYLAQNTPTKAIAQFGNVVKKAGKTDAAYYAAQWYTCLALLKQGEVHKADSTAKAITQTKSPYAENAVALTTELGGK